MFHFTKKSFTYHIHDGHIISSKTWIGFELNSRSRKQNFPAFRKSFSRITDNPHIIIGERAIK